MPSPVVVDGRTDTDKLHELLALGAEHAELDFKATLDLTDNRQALNFAKDCIAMMNSSTGGYIVVGVGDDGAPAHEHDPVDASRFDSADLSQLVARYVDVPLNLVRAQHELDGRTVVLICVQPTPQSLPALIARIGQFEDDYKRMKTVLTEGVLYVRSGTQNVTASDGHWPMLLERYRASVVAETRDGLDALVRRVVEALGQTEPGQARPVPPLLLELDNATFAEAFVQHLDSHSDVQLRRWLRQTTSAASYSPLGDRAAIGNALDKLAIAAIQSMLYRKAEVFDMVLAAMQRAYESGGHINYFNANIEDEREVAVAQYWLDVLLRVFLVGAASVRDEQWWAVANIAKRPLEISVGDPYESWLRHGGVYAGRANLLSGGGERGGLILSMARELGQSEPAFREDIIEVEGLRIGQAPQGSDLLLDSLARFDLLWCVVMAVTAPRAQVGYAYFPSCAALRQSRAQPAIRALATRPDVREGLLASASDEQVARGLEEVLELAVNQASHFRSHWDGAIEDQDVVNFIDAHKAP